MDIITQMAFGAVVGQAGWRERFGRRALAAGALCGLVPDLDTVVNFNDPFASWLYHRGISHSLLVTPFLGLALGFAIWFYYRWRYRRGNRVEFIPLVEDGALGAWLWLGIATLMTHSYLDFLTSYGTQLLAPLSDTRFALNAMPIIDFTYTLILLTALVFGISRRFSAQAAQHIALVAIIASVIWQIYAWDINHQAEAKARVRFSAGVSLHAYPTLFTPFLRRIHVELPEQIYIGYWRSGEDEVDWHIYDKQVHPLIEKVKAERGFKILDWFTRSQIFWRVAPLADGGVRIEAHDLRYIYDLPDESSQAGLRSLWGVRQDFDKNGNALGALKRWTVPLDINRIVNLFWRY